MPSVLRTARTDPRRQRAIDRYRAGDPVEEIAAEAEVHSSTVYDWANYAGVRRQPRPRDPRESEAVERYRAGESARAVALALGVRSHHVYAWARDAGVRSGARRRNRGERAEAAALYQSGLSMAEIAERFDVTTQCVRRWLDLEGVRPIPRRTQLHETAELRAASLDELQAACRKLEQRGYRKVARDPGVGEYRIDHERGTILWRERPQWYSTVEAAVALSEAAPELPAVAHEDVRGAIHCGLLVGVVARYGVAARIPHRVVEGLIAVRRRHAAAMQRLANPDEERRRRRDGAAAV